uniref:Integrase_H2C2 domain-containing protein n=1 Tax=Macrostomum lignano TaxID=282301 RepID=A0A1I8IKS1_9PLAT
MSLPGIQSSAPSESVNLTRDRRRPICQLADRDIGGPVWVQLIAGYRMCLVAAAPISEQTPTKLAMPPARQVRSVFGSGSIRVPLFPRNITNLLLFLATAALGHPRPPPARQNGGRCGDGGGEKMRLNLLLALMFTSAAACELPMLGEELGRRGCQERRHLARGIDLAYRHLQKVRLLLSRFESAAGTTDAEGGGDSNSWCWKPLTAAAEQQDCDLVRLAEFRLRLMTAAVRGLQTCPGCDRDSVWLARHLARRIFALNATVFSDLPRPQSPEWPQSLQSEAARQLACLEAAAKPAQAASASLQRPWSRRRRQRWLGRFVTELRAAAAELESEFGAQPAAELLASANDEAECNQLVKEEQADQLTALTDDYSGSVTWETSTPTAALIWAGRRLRGPRARCRQARGGPGLAVRMGRLCRVPVPLKWSMMEPVASAVRAAYPVRQRSAAMRPATCRAAASRRHGGSAARAGALEGPDDRPRLRRGPQKSCLDRRHRRQRACRPHKRICTSNTSQMSRQPAKGRADRGKGAQSTPNPAVQNEIIPGKFTEHDWNLAMGPSENEEFVLGIVNDVVDTALSEIYEKYLQRQLIPYTVSLAKDAMLQIIEWNFLSHDEGESPDRLTGEAWSEDREPASATIDSWGQGCIPKTVLTPRSSRLSTPAPQPEAIAEEDDADLVEAAAAAAESSGVDEEAEFAAATAEAEAETATGPEAGSSRPGARFRFRPYRGKLKSAGLSAMSETLLETELRLRDVDDPRRGAAAEAAGGGSGGGGGVGGMPTSCLSILKVQAGRPPGNKEVIYDEAGNVVSVVKIPADRLPSHRVNVGYRVLQAELEAEKARLEALKRGIRVPQAGAGGAPTAAGRRQVAASSDPPGAERPGARPKVEALPPSLVETIDLAPGVSVREGGLVRSGPPAQRNGNEKFAEIHLKGLRPVQARLAAGEPPKVTATDLLPAGRPIPPIQPAAPPADRCPPELPSPPTRPFPMQARLAAGEPPKVTATDLLPAGRVAVRPPINGRSRSRPSSRPPPADRLSADPHNAGKRWSQWADRFEDFIDASGITNEKQKCKLLSYTAGKEIADIIREEAKPAAATEDGQVTLKQTLDALKTFFNGRKNIVFARYQFRLCTQATGESIESWYARLRTAAEPCDFEQLKDSLIRDQLVATCSSDKLRRRLLQEANISLEEALRKARAFEAAEELEKTARQTPRATANRRGPADDQQAPAASAPAPLQKATLPATLPRARCRGHHRSSQTAAGCSKSHQCRCRRLNEDVFALYNRDKYPSDVSLTVQVANRQLPMMIDSGASCSIMSLGTFRALSLPSPRPTRAEVRAYGIVGTADLDIQVGSARTTATFHIMDGDGLTILGRQPAFKLGVLKIQRPEATKPQNINAIADTTPSEQCSDPQLKAILQRHKEVFNGIGCIKGVEVQIQLSDDAVPVCQAPSRSTNPADLLSRQPLPERRRNVGEELDAAFINAVSTGAVPKGFSLDQVREASRTDRDVQAALNAIRTGRWDMRAAAQRSFKSISGELSKATEYYSASLRRPILQLAHTGHLGADRTLKRLQTKVWWPRMRSDCELFVQCCTLCQAAATGLRQTPLRPTDIPDGAWLL